jgi:hypothetical protein
MRVIIQHLTKCGTDERDIGNAASHPPAPPLLSYRCDFITAATGLAAVAGDPDATLAANVTLALHATRGPETRDERVNLFEIPRRARTPSNR